MKKHYTFFLFLILFFSISILADNSVAFSRANNSLDKPKETKSKLYEEPDLLIPQPETPKEIKKKEKDAKKAMKKSAKKVKPEKFKKSKKIHKVDFETANKNNKAPKTFAQYVEVSKEVKRADMKIAKHEFTHDEKLINLPDPNIVLAKYNKIPGARELDLRLLLTQHQLVTQGVISPDKSCIAYSVVYSYPTSEQVASEMFVIDVPKNLSLISALKNIHTIDVNREPILKAGTNTLFQYEKRTFTIVDWSEDGKKIAVKEKIGSQTQGPWKTQIWTYDFETGRGYELTALREAIRYYWKNEHQLDLIDYMWDIYPLGWDLYNKDRIVSYAYAYGKDRKGAKFLGTWSIDFKNQRSELMSETSKDFEVSINGYCLELKNP